MQEKTQKKELKIVVTTDDKCPIYDQELENAATDWANEHPHAKGAISAFKAGAEWKGKNSIPYPKDLFQALLNVVGAKDCSGDAYEQVLLPHKDGGAALRIVFRDEDIVVDRYSKADSVWTDEDMLHFAVWTGSKKISKETIEWYKRIKEKKL